MWWSYSLTVGPIVYCALGDAVAESTVAVKVHNWTNGAVDWELLPVLAETGDLSIKVGEVATLKEWIIRKANARNYMRSAESNLLSLREELISGSIQNHLSNNLDRHEIFWPDLGGVENVEIEIMLFGFRDDLDTEAPLWICSIVDGLKEILTMKVWILTGKFEGLIPDKRMNTQLWDPVKLDKESLPLSIDQCEGYKILV